MLIVAAIPTHPTSSSLIQPHQNDNTGLLPTEQTTIVNKVNTFTRPGTLQASHTAATEERRKDVTEQRQKKGKED